MVKFSFGFLLEFILTKYKKYVAVTYTANALPTAVHCKLADCMNYYWFTLHLFYYDNPSNVCLIVLSMRNDM